MDQDYLQLLAKRQKAHDPSDEDYAFYESHRNEIKEDRKLRSAWDKFIFGRPRECTDFFVGLAASIEGIPVLFDNVSTLYSNVFPYLNFDDIISSLILTKATGHQHGAGGLPREGFDLSGGTANKANYETFVRWISEGAEDN